MVQTKRTHRVPARSTRARLAGLELPVVNLSLGGACLIVEDGIRVESPFTLELQHPHLAAPAPVKAEVVWSSPTERAGVRFVDLTPAERTLVRRCMLAEYGHAVWSAPGAPRPVGYVVPMKPGLWGVFDDGVRELGQLRRDGRKLFFRPTAGSTGAEAGVPTPNEAARRAFALPRPPRLDPALDAFEGDLPGAPTGLSGSSVLLEGKLIGWVARTGESWSFFDAQKEPLGFMTHAPQGEWRVVVLGDNEDGSLDVRKATSYPGALAAAFSLGAEQPPELRSAVFQPKSLLEL